MDRYVVDVTQIIISATSLCTFLLTLYIAVQAQRIHIKAENISTKTETLVKQTNSMTDRIVAQTDTIARAEGVIEGIAKATASIINKGPS